MLPSPRTSDTNGAGEHGDGGMDLRTAVALLPTPATKEPGGTPEQYHARLMLHDGRESTFLPLSMAVQLLPTPTRRDDAWVPMEASENTMRRGDPDGPRRNTSGSLPKDIGLEREADRWGEYGPAIRRWEALTRPAPEPTKLNGKGNPKLSDLFDEWLMGFPAGWITDVPGVTWNETLKACGNGVVPQQGAAGVTHLVTVLMPWGVAA